MNIPSNLFRLGLRDTCLPLAEKRALRIGRRRHDKEGKKTCSSYVHRTTNKHQACRPRVQQPVDGDMSTTVDVWCSSFLVLSLIAYFRWSCVSTL